MDKEIVFWLNTEPVCCKGVFDAVARLHDQPVYYVFSEALDECRKMISKEESSGSLAKHVLLKSNEEIAYFIDLHQDAVHVFGGYRNKNLDLLIKKSPKATTIVWSERPCPPKIKRKFPYSLLHKYFAFKYRKKISALLPLGRLGVEDFARFGWPKSMMYPFLYLPEMNESLPKKTIGPSFGKPFKIVYLGRFTNGSKGLDVLIDAQKKIRNCNYKMTIVGGYGDMLEEALAWCESSEFVEFGGTWPITEACDRLADFDLCVVPSKYEGWNVTVNEALMAGVGCICTDECVSDEIVRAARAGVVVEAGDSDSLARAIEDALSDPDIISSWCENAFSYRSKMTAEACAQYFLDVLDFVQRPGEVGARPEPSWL